MCAITDICNKRNENGKCIQCHRCNNVFHILCIAKYGNMTDKERIEVTLCDKCGIRFDISEMLCIYSYACTETNKIVYGVDNMIKDREKKFQDIQKEYNNYKEKVLTLSKQREISKQIVLHRIRI